MAFYDDGKPVGGYGMKSNSDYTIEDIISDLGGGSGSVGENVEFGIALSINSSPAATFLGSIIDASSEQAITIRPESTGIFVGTASAGSLVQYIKPDGYNVMHYRLLVFTSKDEFIAEHDTGIVFSQEGETPFGIIPAQGGYGALIINIGRNIG